MTIDERFGIDFMKVYRRMIFAMRRELLFLSGLTLITFACLWPVTHLGFIGYDDLDYVYQNPAVQSGLNSESIAWAFGGFHAGNWHPVTWLSHMLDCELFGLNPREEHRVNLLFHITNTVLIFIWLRQLTGAQWRSFFVAALFATHPLHVQSVAWISERKDVLSGCFCLGTLIAYTRYCRQKNVANFILVIVLFALGLMAKPMLVTLPLVLLLLDFWPLARVPVRAPGPFTLKSVLIQWQPVFLEKISLFLLCAASCIVTVYAQQSAGAMHATEVLPLENRIAHAVISYVLYLWKMIWPVNLAIFYPLPLTEPNGLTVIGAFLLLVALTALAFWRRKHQPYLLVGWLWFLVMLVPVIGVIQVGLQSMADRYAYLPSIGLFIALAWGMASFATHSSAKQTIVAGCGGILVLACGLDTRHQLSFWRDNISLFQHVVEVSPENNSMGYFYLGISQAEKGDLDAAANSLTTALKGSPDFVMAKQRLGNVLLLQKKYAGAEAVLEPVILAHPDDFATRAALGMALAGQGKYLAAHSEYEAARRLVPDNPQVNELYAANAPKAGAELAILNLTSQLTTNDSPEIRVQIAQAQSFLGRYPEAVQQYDQALARAPDSPEVLNNLAWLLATCPEAAVRNGPLAVKYARHACELSHFKKTILIGTLAAAYAEAGQFDDAIATARKACGNASAQGETGLLKSNQELMTLYQNHQPYHEDTASSGNAGD